MWPDTPTLLVFAGASLVLLLTPGPAILFIVVRSAHLGVRAGLVSALGVHGGTLLHIAAAVAGVSVIVASSATAFGVLKYAGACYLVYLGVRMWSSAGKRNGALEPLPPRGAYRLFFEGATVNLLNPKTALFFLAFLPQFVDPAAGSVAVQLLTLGLIFAALGLLSDSIFALAAGTVARWFASRRVAGRRGRIATGAVYVGLGVTAALAERPTK